MTLVVTKRLQISHKQKITIILSSAIVQYLLIIHAISKACKFTSLVHGFTDLNHHHCYKLLDFWLGVWFFSWYMQCFYSTRSWWWASIITMEATSPQGSVCQIFWFNTLIYTPFIIMLIDNNCLFFLPCSKLDRNILSGNIPREWALTKLESL